MKKREEAEEDRRRQEARALGTPVTPESFAKWKAAFEEEQLANKIATGDVVEEEVIAMSTKKTGKQFFFDKYALQAAGGAGGDDLELDEEDIVGEDEEGFDGIEEGEEEDDEGDEDSDADEDDLDMLDAMVAERA